MSVTYSGPSPKLRSTLVSGCRLPIDEHFAGLSVSFRSLICPSRAHPDLFRSAPIHPRQSPSLRDARILSSIRGRTHPSFNGSPSKKINQSFPLAPSPFYTRPPANGSALPSNPTAPVCAKAPQLRVQLACSAQGGAVDPQGPHNLDLVRRAVSGVANMTWRLSFWTIALWHCVTSSLRPGFALRTLLICPTT